MKLSMKVRNLFILLLTLFLILGSSTVFALANVNKNNSASIRTTGKQGLKFRATVDDLTDSIEHGFYIAIGNHSIDEMIESIENETLVIDSNKVVRAVVDGDKKTFSVVIYNIQQKNYQTEITALSYVKYSDSVEYSTDVTTRSVFEVAYNAYLDGNREEYIVEIFNSSYADVTYHYNYSYQSLDELCNEFLVDYNEYTDTEITKEPVYRRAQLGVGYLAQEASVFRQLSVEDNIRAVLEMSNFPKDYQKQRLEEMLDEFGLQHIRKSKGIQLSGGERRRTEIARALSIAPKFILLDEPFAGVDPIAVEDIQSIVQKLKEKNIGILITDHNVQETLCITDRAYLLYDGTILQSGTAEDLANDPEVRRVYLGKNFELRRKK